VVVAAVARNRRPRGLRDTSPRNLAGRARRVVRNRRSRRLSARPLLAGGL